MNRRRVGEDRGSKEMDGCPLTADVAGLSTAVTGLCEWFEGLSAVDIHRDARRECT
jgi:hypothetical protein